MRRVRFVTAVLLVVPSLSMADGPVRLAPFDVDATPPVGTSMAYDPVVRVEALGLRCRGIVLLGAGEPIVLCAVDWIGIGNGGYDAFREQLADAAGTDPSRVAVHTLHQHDAPRCDFSAERLLLDAGVRDTGAFDSLFARDVLRRVDAAVRAAVPKARPVTHAGLGTATVEDVASNRRILGEDGLVRAVRFTATRDPLLRAEPAGTVDPRLGSLSFWNGGEPLAVLTYFACHPQSYYRTGVPSPDFPGLARLMISQDVPAALHVHFNGAGGNVGAGKYNDGAAENRMVLAGRLADAMRQAHRSTRKFPLTAADLQWRVAPVALPPAEHLDEGRLREQLEDWTSGQYWGAPDALAWLLRCRRGHRIELSCLTVGDVRVLHMPGELFVEYQLAAQKLRPDATVLMAAYGDYGPGYIGTAVAYGQGGYETSPQASSVAPAVEEVLMNGIRMLLEAPQ